MSSHLTNSSSKASQPCVRAQVRVTLAFCGAKFCLYITQMGQSSVLRESSFSAMNEEKEKNGEDKNKDILSCMIDMQLGKSESTPELLRLRLLGHLGIKCDFFPKTRQQDQEHSQIVLPHGNDNNEVNYRGFHNLPHFYLQFDYSPHRVMN
jgi:hypothetical protein